MRLPSTTGEDRPRPGTGTFQAMLFVSLQTSGSFLAVALPSPCGPRNWGQASSALPRPATNGSITSMATLTPVRSPLVNPARTAALSSLRMTRQSLGDECEVVEAPACPLFEPDERFARGSLVRQSVVVRRPARFYELTVPDFMILTGEQRHRRHRRLRLRRSLRMLITALFLIALIYLTVSFLNRPGSLSSPGPEVPDDSPPVQFK